ncbi:hypothetical protein [Almyronema epifaneia]|uniref:Uncharacterized protein n=1 Tax=Almyronema epifaneia S1 TaxID=2991925 RepID=A0ABW6II42_9CYAN
MPLSKTETKQLIERLIFDETAAPEWVQDVWDLNPLMGEKAAKLLDVFELLVDYASADQLDSLLQALYREQV